MMMVMSARISVPDTRAHTQRRRHATHQRNTNLLRLNIVASVNENEMATFLHDARKKNPLSPPPTVVVVTHSFKHNVLTGNEENPFRWEKRTHTATSSRSNRHQNELSKKQIYFTRSSSPPPTRPSLAHTHTRASEATTKAKKIPLKSESSDKKVALHTKASK